MHLHIRPFSAMSIFSIGGLRMTSEDSPRRYSIHKQPSHSDTVNSTGSLSDDSSSGNGTPSLYEKTTSLDESLTLNTKRQTNKVHAFPPPPTTQPPSPPIPPANAPVWSSSSILSPFPTSQQGQRPQMYPIYCMPAAYVAATTTGVGFCNNAGGGQTAPGFYPVPLRPAMVPASWLQTYAVAPVVSSPGTLTAQSTTGASEDSGQKGLMPGFPSGSDIVWVVPWIVSPINYTNCLPVFSFLDVLINSLINY